MATELAKAYVQIVPSASGIKGAITSELSPEAEDAGKSAGSSIASTIKKAIVAAGIGEVLKSAISEGAALEQSIGGIETLFKDSADTMKKYAQAAYETAGISANDYMEQVTSFSASLLSSVDGDTKVAADAANQAIIDMADNSNKMGTSLESIQNAYQGFAKQNYTMLDNLKLGYGGTKDEMSRLLADAEKLTGVKYNINNLSDVYSAIHAIQDSLDITGTTAKEASTTISGSLASMKASLSNILGYMVIGEDIKPYIQQFVRTAATFLFGNLIPALGNIITSLPSALATFVQTALPLVLKQGKTIVTSIASGISEKGFDVVYAVGNMITEALEMMLTEIPKFMENGASIVKNIVNGILSKLPDIVAAVISIVTKIAATIIEHLPDILAAGIKIIAGLLSGIISAIPNLIKGLPRVVSSVKNYFKAVNWATIGKAIISGIANGIKNGISTIANAAKEAAKSALNSAKKALGINSPSKLFREQVGEMVSLGIAEGISDGSNAVDSAIKSLTKASSISVDATYGMTKGGYAVKNATENLVNGLGGLVNASQGGMYTINLNVDSKTLAQVLFNPLEEVSTQRRIAIGY